MKYDALKIVFAIFNDIEGIQTYQLHPLHFFQYEKSEPDDLPFTNLP